MMEMLLKADNVSLGYDGKTVAEGIGFEVLRGDYLCVVGENGSGKSTLIKALTGINPPLSGSIEKSPKLKNGGIGYLPQQTDLQRDFPASVREIVLSGCLKSGKFRPFYTKSDRKTASENMEKMGIKNLENKCFRELSGGQRQRVLLARALCAGRELLILDEPVSGLDTLAEKEMYSVIKELNDEGIAVIMITHDIKAAEKYADKFLVIGKEVFYGTRDEFIKKQTGEN